MVVVGVHVDRGRLREGFGTALSSDVRRIYHCRALRTRIADRGNMHWHFCSRSAGQRHILECEGLVVDAARWEDVARRVWVCRVPFKNGSSWRKGRRTAQMFETHGTDLEDHAKVTVGRFSHKVSFIFL